MGSALAPGVWAVLAVAGVRGVVVPLVTTLRHVVVERARRATLCTAAREVPVGGVLVEERADGSTITVHAGKTVQRRTRSRRRR